MKLISLNLIAKQFHLDIEKLVLDLADVLNSSYLLKVCNFVNVNFYPISKKIINCTA